MSSAIDQRTLEHLIVQQFERNHASLAAGLFDIFWTLKDAGVIHPAVDEIRAAALYCQLRGVRPVEIRRSNYSE